MVCDLEIVKEVNRKQLSEMERIGGSLNPERHDSCAIFKERVRGVQSAIMHTYQIVAHLALRESDPEKAADLWQYMGDLSADAVHTLKKIKDLYSGCGAPELYDLVLDYKLEADKRQRENRQDAECLKIPFPPGLFPKMS